MHEGRKPLMDKRSTFIFAVHEEDKYLIMLLKITAIFLFLTVSDDELKYKELELNLSRLHYTANLSLLLRFY